MKLKFIKKMRKLFLLLFLLFSTSLINGQKIYKYDNSEVKLIFFDKNISQYVPHLINEYTLGMARHNQLWNMPPFDTFINKHRVNILHIRQAN